jgi:hypothetical protein
MASPRLAASILLALPLPLAAGSSGGGYLIVHEGTLPGGGGDVDVSGDTAVSIGSGPSANVPYVFVEQGGTWSQQATLSPGNNASISVWQDTAVHGRLWQGKPNCAYEGFPYAFERTGTSWSASNPIWIDGHDSPGHSTWIGVDGTGTPMMLLGDPAEDFPPNFAFLGCDWGAVDVMRLENGWWTRKAWIGSPPSSPTYGFGWDVAASGDVMLVSEQSEVFVLERTGGNSWARKASIPAPWAAVDVDGDTAVVGIPLQGKFEIWRAQGNWNTVVRELQVTGAAELGTSVTIDGDTVAIGSPTQGKGRVHVYHRSGTTWTKELEYVAPTAQTAGRFGSAVALEGNRLVVGEESTGQTHFFELRWLEPPATYCTAKLNSQGCTPAIGFSGCPSATDPNPFDVTAAMVLNNKSGTLFYGLSGPLSAPFQGGTMCVQGPRKRTPLQTSGGNPPPNDCSGLFSYDFNARIQSGLDPNLVPGVRVHAQYWYRDAGAPFQTGLSDALEFDVLP